MSLWHESLSLELYDWDDNPVKKAKCILAYLSMPVPRSWWENTLKTGRIDSGLATLLIDLQRELSKYIDFSEKLSPSLLVALAFIDDDEPGKSSGRFEDTASGYTPEDYFESAKKV
jgi:hypothetical protein